MNVSPTIADARQAIRRLAQTLMFVGPLSVVTVKSWRAMMFPHDEQPWLLIVALLIAAAVPAAIWCREAWPTRTVRRVELLVSSAAAVAGTAMFLLSTAWAGFLLTGPYAGPMSMEATFFFLIGAGVLVVGSAFLIASPLLLDAAFYPQTFRAGAWKLLGFGLPALAIAAMSVGSRLDQFFR